MLLFQTMVFWLATRRGRDDIVDIGWGLSFILLTWVWWLASQLSWSHLNTWVSTIVAFMITIWGLRLSIYILGRFMRSPHEDSRYTDLKSRWSNRSLATRYLRIYVIQALLASLVALPVFTIMISVGGSWPLTHEQARWIWICVVVWAVGFVIEATADIQLRKFVQQRTGNTTMQAGLWRYSRHPNYFGELLQWWMIGLIGAIMAGSMWLIPLMGPALLSYLIIFVSGIPPSEARANKRRDWSRYKGRTSMLIPLPPRE